MICVYRKMYIIIIVIASLGSADYKHLVTILLAARHDVLSRVVRHQAENGIFRRVFVICDVL